MTCRIRGIPRNNSIGMIMSTALEYAWAIVVLLEGNSVYQHLSTRYLHLSLICVLVSLLLLFAKMAGKIKKKTLLIGILLFVYSFFYYFAQSAKISDEGFVTTMLIGLPVMVMLLDHYAGRGEPYRLFHCLANVVYVLTIFSLIVWLLGSVLGAIPTNSSLRVTWGRDKIIHGYFGLQFETSMDTTYGIENIWRNQSLFTEAPMYNLWLCIALSTEMFLQEHISKKKCAVLIAGILSTLTTTGLLFCILVFGLLYFETITRGKSILKVIFIFFLIALVPAGLYLAQIIYTYKAQTLSYTWRVQSYIMSWKAFTDNPIFGTGFGSLASFQSNMNTAAGFSNSFMVIFATGGLWLIALFGVSLAGYFVRPNRLSGSRIRKFGICYLFLYLLVSFSARYIAIVYWGLGIALMMNRRRSAQMGSYYATLRQRPGMEGVRSKV